MGNNIMRCEYNGTQVTFELGDSMFVNATQMAKCFGKSPVDWLQTQAAKDYIEALATTQKCVPSDLVIEDFEGDISDTWMPKDVALEFAHWLSPEFGSWCNDRILELTNEVVTYSVDSLDYMIDLLSYFKKVGQRNAELEDQIRTLNNLLGDKRD